eukprot:snap_masked-scaffold_4-processed-gene-4.27-mRNA-1 protein AED:1.00 eAED:1.00 QI:0/-1/0/0/-1/1/1/0/90
MNCVIDQRHTLKNSHSFPSPRDLVQVQRRFESIDLQPTKKTTWKDRLVKSLIGKEEEHPLEKEVRQKLSEGKSPFKMYREVSELLTGRHL